MCPVREKRKSRMSIQFSTRACGRKCLPLTERKTSSFTWREGDMRKTECEHEMFFRHI